MIIVTVLLLVATTTTTTTTVNGWIPQSSSSLSSRTPPCRWVMDQVSLVIVSANPVQISPVSLMEENDELEDVVVVVDDDDDDDELDNNNDILDDHDNDGIEYATTTPAQAETQVKERMQKLQHLARTSSRDKHAVAKAHAILDDMFERYVQTNDSTFLPSTQVYNYILEAYAYSKDEQGAQQAMELLDKMHDPDNVSIARPNVETYLNVMDAHAMRHNPDQVLQLIHQQQERSKVEDNSVPVTVDAYNKLIKAYGIAGNIAEAERTFRSLLTDNMANHKTWVQLMKAYLSQDDAATVISLFQEMMDLSTENDEYQPQTEAYNILIRAMGIHQGPTQAEAKLYEMMDRFRRGDESCQPNADTFRHVIFAYNQDRKQQHTAVTVSKLDQLLQIQDSFLSWQHENSNNNEEEEPWTLDERLYNIVVGIVARSSDAKKAIRAKKILDRFQKSKTPSSSSSSSNLRRMYFSVLSACAYVTKDATAQDKLNAFQIALQVWNDIRKDSSKVKLNSSMAGMFLLACRNLLPAGSKREEVVQEVFDDCCHRGIINDFVLDELDALTNATTQLRWFGGFIADGVRIKQEWRRNVKT